MSNSNELTSKLRMVAEYDNVPLTRTRQDKNGNPFEGKIRLRYNTSWNWLLPVWAKVVDQLDKMDSSDSNEIDIERIFIDYHTAIDSNNITEAFNVVCDAITLTTKL